MRVVFHGLLKKLYGESVTLLSATSVADALEGVSTQLKDWPRKLGVTVPGFDDVESFYRKDDLPEEVHLVPSLSGGGGKAMNFILGAVLVVVGIVLVATGWGTAIGISLIVSGSMMILQGIIMLFMKAPKIDQEKEVEGSKYLGLNRNTVATRTPITLAWGRVKLYPHWLSLQSDSSLMAHGTFPTTPT